MLLEDLREAFHPSFRWTREVAGPFVHRDEVHVVVRGPAQALDALGQLPRVVLGVVDAREQHVLERHAAFGPRDVARGRAKHLVDVPALVQWDDRATDRVIRRMERDREVHRQIQRGELIHLRDDADR